ncbi:hypothetical protein LIA77_00672 [Sarocladium implicatum]|nr:hypothetical protein LIA77_00672 [Sarocladium implicatum]
MGRGEPALHTYIHTYIVISQLQPPSARSGRGARSNSTRCRKSGRQQALGVFGSRPAKCEAIAFAPKVRLLGMLSGKWPGYEKILPTSHHNKTTSSAIGHVTTNSPA